MKYLRLFADLDSAIDKKFITPLILYFTPKSKLFFCSTTDYETVEFSADGDSIKIKTPEILLGQFDVVQNQYQNKKIYLDDTNVATEDNFKIIVHVKTNETTGENAEYDFIWYMTLEYDEIDNYHFYAENYNEEIYNEYIWDWVNISDCKEKINDVYISLGESLTNWISDWLDNNDDKYNGWTKITLSLYKI